MVRNSRDHYRPVLQLRHFADAEGLLWVYDRSGTAPAFRQIAPNVGFEKGLYSILEPPDIDAGAVEKWLAEHIDGPAAAALDKAAVDQSLTRAERSVLAAFVGAQDLRTPRAKERVLSLYRAGFAKVWDEWRSKPKELAAAIARDSGTIYSAAEILDMLGEYQYEVTPNAWLDFFGSMLNRVGRRLYHMRWLRAYAPEDLAFLTSDVGIVKCHRRPDAFMSWDMGFNGGRDTWIFPLKPEVALVIAPPGGPGLSGPCKPEWLRAVNRHIWDDAYRWVFSCKVVPDGGPAV